MKTQKSNSSKAKDLNTEIFQWLMKQDIEYIRLIPPMGFSNYNEFDKYDVLADDLIIDKAHYLVHKAILKQLVEDIYKLYKPYYEIIFEKMHMVVYNYFMQVLNPVVVYKNSDSKIYKTDAGLFIWDSYICKVKSLHTGINIIKKVNSITDLLLKASK